ncbi:MAG: hypothetical protein KAW88_01000, partial [Candidatus Cloacimonetes bacterium]|nr:hypothetical protein [Candidatus Cloacimonadota bacterium]
NPEDAFTYHNRGMSYAHLKEFDNCIKDFQLLTLNIDVFPIVIKPTYDFLFKFIADNFKVSDSIQNLFNKGISIERILKHILILMHYKQNEIIKTYFSEKSWKIMESLKSPYPLVISFSALFNLIETVSSADSKYMEFASLWLNIIKHIVFENKKQKEDTFNKSLMLIYAFAIKEKKSAEMTEQVLKLINKEYHPIAELHYYIPKALIDEKDTDVQKLMKDSIFEATVEKIKDQRKNI